MSESPANHPAVNLANQLLLASPTLGSGAVHQSVVMLGRHSRDQGAAGYILNQPSGRLIIEVFPSKEFAPIRSVPVFHGGPVEPRGITFGVLWAAADHQVRMEMNVDSVATLARRQRMPRTIVRAFFGHIQWPPGQLEAELAASLWIPATPSPSLLTEPHDPDLWSKLLGGLSPYHQFLAAPEDPAQN